MDSHRADSTVPRLPLSMRIRNGHTSMPGIIRPSTIVWLVHHAMQVSDAWDHQMPRERYDVFRAYAAARSPLAQSAVCALGGVHWTGRCS